MDPKSKSFGGNQRGRIILLGDGTEVLTDSDDTEMFDRSEEDRDLDSQVSKGAADPKKLNDPDPNYKGVADTEASTKSGEEKSADTKK